MQADTPSEALLQLCEPPRLTRTETVRDLVANSMARQDAYDRCAARQCRLVQRIQQGSHVDAVECADSAAADSPDTMQKVGNPAVPLRTMEPVHARPTP